MKRGMACFSALLLMAVTASTPAPSGAQSVQEDAFEVWIIDQSNTRDENGNGSVIDAVDSGGTLYIYEGHTLNGQAAAETSREVIDLGAAARNFCVAQTGTAPIRPHKVGS